MINILGQKKTNKHDNKHDNKYNIKKIDSKKSYRK